MGIKFLGGSALDGKTVSITASQAGFTASRSIASYGNAPAQSGEITILSSVAGAVASPMGVNFEVSAVDGLGDDPFYTMEVVWDYGDDYAFRHITPSLLNDGMSGTSRGHLGTHVYPNPGVYFATCTAYGQNGATATATVQINVPDANVVYAGSLTRCVSAGGDWTGAPSGAQLITWNPATEYTGLFTPGHRTLFKAGDVYSVSTTMAPPDVADKSPLQIGRFGSGADPRFNVSGGAVGIEKRSRACPATVYEIDISGGYDPAAANDWFNEATPPVRPGNGINVNVPQSPEKTMSSCIFRCRVSGFDVNYYPGGSTEKILYDTDLSGWYNFGFFGGNRDDGKMGIAGVKIEQPDSAILGREFTLAQRGTWNLEGEPNLAVHGPVRVNDASNFVVINKCDLFSNTGWSASVSPDNRASVQPCLRLGTIWQGSGAENVSVTQCKMRGGFRVLEMVNNSNRPNQAQGKPKAWIIDAVELIANERSSAFIATEKPGTLVRNSFLRYNPTGAKLEGNNISIYSVDERATDGTGPHPMRFYNNTLIMEAALPATGRLDFALTGFGVPTVIENNVFQAAGAYTISTSSPIVTAQDNWLPLDADGRPQSGSLAFETATTGLASILDALGNQRGANPSRGALEPA